MSVQETVEKRQEYLRNVGKFALSSMFPDDFEVYVTALELINSDGETLRYFIFPIMPNTIDEAISFNSNIKKTFGGVSVLSTTNFIPTDITLSGSFGRKFQVLLGDVISNLTDSFKKVVTGTKKTLEFDSRIKTGYGSCKVLQSILEESKTLDNGKSKTLILYNLALGNSYIVKPVSLRFTQSQETNMVWNYSLSLKSIAPLSLAFSSKKMLYERVKLGGTALLQQELSQLTSRINQVLLI